MAEQAILPGAKSEPPRRRARIVYALVGVLLVFIATRGGVLWWEYDQALTEAQRRAESLSNVLSAHLDRTFGLDQVRAQPAGGDQRTVGRAAGRTGVPVARADRDPGGARGVGSLNVIDADGGGRSPRPTRP